MRKNVYVQLDMDDYRVIERLRNEFGLSLKQALVTIIRFYRDNEAIFRDILYLARKINEVSKNGS